MPVVPTSERERGTKIKDMPLDQRIGDNPLAPTAAQVRALVDISNGRPIPEEIQQAILKAGKSSQNALRRVLATWQGTIEAGLGSQEGLKRLGIINLADSIAIASSEFPEEFSIIKEQLKIGMQTALIEETP